MVNRRALPARVMILGLVIGLAAMAWLFGMLPASVEFSLAVVVGVVWCIWLDRHPEAPADQTRLTRREGRGQPAWPRS